MRNEDQPGGGEGVLLTTYLPTHSLRNRGLDSIQTSRRISILLKMVSLKEMIHCLEDLINYFAYPEDDLGESFI